jgi:hypothetical protein
MIMKQSFPLLRVIGLSAGLVASAAMMPSVHAATSATITATGNVPVACNVSPVNINMTKVDAKTLRGTESGLYSTGSSTTFELSAPTLDAPSGYSGIAYIALEKNGTIVAQMNSVPTGSNDSQHVISSVESDSFTYVAEVNGGAGLADLLPGDYIISSTITCMGQ